MLHEDLQYYFSLTCAAGNYEGYQCTCFVTLSDKLSGPTYLVHIFILQFTQVQPLVKKCLLKSRGIYFYRDRQKADSAYNIALGPKL